MECSDCNGNGNILIFRGADRTRKCSHCKGTGVEPQTPQSEEDAEEEAFERYAASLAYHFYG